MKRRAPLTALVLSLVLGLGIALAADQADFKVPFPIRAGGKNLAAGDYAVSSAGEGGLVLRQVSSGREVPLTVLERIARPDPAPAEPRLVFDEVGDFAPSYTEYITVYVLSEVWLPGQDGYRVHITKGAHKTKVVTGAAAK
ncbi:MAG: hypothetical protein JW775_03630 [Candidatus Aminicenantes bacterium]|nr:hypothetical protein [Candidatus Aminicenantes bacterium]